MSLKTVASKDICDNEGHVVVYEIDWISDRPVNTAARRILPGTLLG